MVQVGILTIPGDKMFRGDRHNYIDIIETGRKNNVNIFVITTDLNNYHNNYLFGYTYSKNRKPMWQQEKLPLPQVVYNRIPYRENELSIESLNVLNFFEKKQIPLFNPHFFNKLQLFDWLNKDKILRENLPPTKPFTHNDQLLKFLNKYRNILLKPVYGKAGEGFFRIERSRSNYTIYYQHENINWRKEVVTTAELFQILDQNKEPTLYIMQKVVPLLTYNNRNFDLRLLLQKDKFAKWQITGIGIRLAGENSITTHVPRGGEIKDLIILKKIMGRENYPMFIKKVKNLALLIAAKIEENVDSFLGEMSMDIGIDNNFHLWFFEANAKPQKFDEPKIREKSLKRLMEIFHYLGGKKIASTYNY